MNTQVHMKPNKKRILCFGDSLTWGFEPVNHLRFDEEDRWPQVMQHILGETYVVIEEGQCGRTIATDDPAEGEKNGLLYLQPCLESHKPFDLLCVMLGSNDCKRKFSYSASDIAGEMQRFLQKVIMFRQFNSPCDFEILLIAPPLITNDIKGKWLEESFDVNHAPAVSKGLARYYRGLAQSLGCRFINAAEYVQVSPVDGCHLDADGQRELGRVIAAYVEEHCFSVQV
ncbi:MAG: SGNH/GDSL hydrolase family protein [Atopobiaceae bacterium]|nr:SGNH/GDSL hydrolase family protein [Atopobiaceae bacterium]